MLDDRLGKPIEIIQKEPIDLSKIVHVEVTDLSGSVILKRASERDEPPYIPQEGSGSAKMKHTEDARYCYN